MKRHLHKWALALLRLGRLCLKGTVNSARDVAKTGAGMTDGCPRNPLSHGSRDHLRMFARPKNKRRHVGERFNDCTRPPGGTPVGSERTWNRFQVPNIPR